MGIDKAHKALISSSPKETAAVTKVGKPDIFRRVTHEERDRERIKAYKYAV